MMANTDKSSEEAAADLIRAKLARIYGDEPEAEAELAEAEAEPEKYRSEHERYMIELKNSGLGQREIQQAWHEYYQSLSEKAKHQVWQEFYDRQAQAAGNSLVGKLGRSNTKSAKKLPARTRNTKRKSTSSRGIAGLKDDELRFHKPADEPLDEAVISDELITPPLRPKSIKRAQKLKPGSGALKKNKITAAVRGSIKSSVRDRTEWERKNLRAKHNLQSLAFGLGFGIFVIIIFMFSFFNEKFIAPFISPGQAYATPIILNPDQPAPTSQPEIIIPKINLEIPLVFNIPSINDSDIETGLQNGVIHYPTTVLPGQQGNSAYFGHSSNNIFSPGQYKFAFALLHELVPGDIFYLTYDKKVYVYKVYDKQIVAPSDVAVLNIVPDKIATATLITCDPPGTSLNRLVVWGEQISPNPSINTSPAPNANISKPQQIVGNGPSLLSRLWPF